MSSDRNAEKDLQFDVADMAGGPGGVDAGGAVLGGGVTCTSCHRVLVDSYFGLGAGVFCGACRDGITAQFQGKGGAGGRLLKAFGFGLGAAILGAAVWWGVSTATGYNIGLVALAVGFMVGWAVRLGSGERGGLGYQFIALGLVYLAIGMSVLPEVFAMANKDGETSPIAIALTSVVVLAMGPFLPLLDGGIISLAINAFALWQGWKMNKGISLAFTGPHAVGGSGGPMAGDVTGGAGGGEVANRGGVL